MMSNVQALLRMCVKEWDRMNKDGADAKESLERVCAHEGLEAKILIDDEACTKRALQGRLESLSKVAAPRQKVAAPSQLASQFGAAITGIPNSGSRVGDTFLLLRLRTRVVVVDSHRHACEGAAGTVIAESQTIKEMVDWIFEVLLKELSCSLEYVSVTAFALQRASLSGNMSLADFARLSSGKAGQRDSLSATSTSAQSAPRPSAQSAHGRSTQSAPCRSAQSAPSRSAASVGQEGREKSEKPPGAPGRPDKAVEKGCGSQPARIQPLQCLSAASSHTCAKFSHTCAQCQWQKHGEACQKLVSFVDASGQNVTPIVERPKYLSGAWAIGCALCANTRTEQGSNQRFQAWAKFEIRQAGNLKQMVLRHCMSEQHRQAVRMAQQPHPAPSQRPAGFSASSVSRPEPELDAVPRAERFVWAIENVARGGSFRDFETWCRTNDLTSQLTSTGVNRDSSRLAGAKMTFCVAAVKVEERQQLLRRAWRLSFAVDDRDQVFVMRARVSFLRPRPGSEDFLVGLVRDYGFEVADSAEAIWQCLRSLCTIRRGRRRKNKPPSGPQPETPGTPPGSQPETPGARADEDGWTSGPEDHVDEELLKRVVRMTIAGASDGCKVALLAVQEVKKRYLSHLRYQFRDRPHTTRTCQKGILKCMNEGKELVIALISGKNSFAKRARYSRRFQKIWLRKQLEAIAEAKRRGGDGSQPDLFVALKNLAHAEHRFDSRSEPMSIMCSRFGDVVEVLLEIASDEAPSHRDDRAWAIEVLNLISGAEGFKKLLIFGVDCDFAVTTQILVRVQDGISPDVALTAAQVADTLEVVTALFREGQVFLPEAEGLYTSQLLKGLRRMRLAARERLGWPAEFDLSGPKAYCKTLHKMTKEFFRLNFPDYEWRRKFGAFNWDEGCFPRELRLQYIGELATKEGVNPDAARSQFLMALPHMKRLYQETGDNREAWCGYVDMLRSKKGQHGVQGSAEKQASSAPSQAKPRTGAELLLIIMTYICLLDCTSDVERVFAKVKLLEMKERERHMCPQLLSAVLRVALEVPASIDGLVARVTEVGKSEMWWKPRPFLLQAMRKYAEFFGTRSLASRSVVVQPGAIRALQTCRQRIGTPRAAKHVTKQAMKQRWCEGAKALVRAWRGRASSAPSQEKPDKKKLSKESRDLHKATMSAQERTQALEKRKFADMESKVGLAQPVGPLQGLPRKKKGKFALARGRAAKSLESAGKSAAKSAVAAAKAALAAPSQQQKSAVALKSAAKSAVALKSAVKSAVAKAALAAPSQQQKKRSTAAAPKGVSPKCMQTLRQAAKKVSATTPAKRAVATTPAKQAVAGSNAVSFFALAKGPVGIA